MRLCPKRRSFRAWLQSSMRSKSYSSVNVAHLNLVSVSSLPLCPSANRLSIYRADPSLIRQEVTSPPLFPPSVNPTGQESSRTSSPPRPLVNPSQQYLTLQFTQSASTILSASQSESSSSPPSSIAIPTPEFGTSSPSAAPGKGPFATCSPLYSLVYADMCSFFPVSFPFSPKSAASHALL